MKAAEMAANATTDVLRELAGFRASKGRAISLYVALDPSAAINPGDVQTKTNSLLSEARSEVDTDGLSHDQREALKADIERIDEFFQGLDRDGVRGMAVFASQLDGVWRTLRLPQPVNDAVKVNDEFHLSPLVPLLRGLDGTLVVQVGREQGRFFRLNRGQLHEVADHTEDAPGQHDQGGWSQARYQRHIDKLVHEHLKTVADELDKRRRGGAPRIVLVGPEGMESDFVETLSKETQQAIVGWAHAEAHAGAAELLEAVTPRLEEALAEEETEIAEAWRESAGKGGRAASGWAETLEAASDGRVETLLVQDGAEQPAYECPKCGRAQLDAGACPLDGATMEPNEGLDLAVRHTLAMGGSVVPLSHRKDLAPVGGIGALLRF
jgi:peptide chain release factor subunit 1